MPKHVCNNAQLQCSFGAAPSTFVVVPMSHQMQTSNQEAANIMDHKPNVNVMPFGMCSAPTNPQVIAATAAALGVFTPQPCVPVTPTPWAPGAITVLLNNQPALDDVSILNCTWLGIIKVSQPGQTTEDIP